MVQLLARKGLKVVVLDNFSTGHRDAVTAGVVIDGDVADRSVVDGIFSKFRIDVVMHFASSISVGESVSNPSKYYWNNIVGSLNLLDGMVRHGVDKLIFSSSAAIFGDPEYMPIDETHPKAPSSPYGRSKLMVEEILADYDRAYGLKHITLRYFNAAGADPEANLGERHEPETHLIPLALQVASGRRDRLVINGADYDTPDGTCIRDYIHVSDLCEAHWLALQHLIEHGASDCFNLGNGQGFSVKQVIESCREITGRDIKVAYGPRREGDPPVLVADSAQARRILGWEPKWPALSQIVEHAWAWERRQ